MKFILGLLFSLLVTPSIAWPVHGSASGGGVPFNNGTWQINTNYGGIGGDYTTLDLMLNTSGNWSWRASVTANPAPNEFDANGYPVPTSVGFASHSGYNIVVRTAAEAYWGGNCIDGVAGICYAYRIVGKGTVVNLGTILTSSFATATVTTGASTKIDFSADQDFRAGMEVPISGTSGVTATNGGGGNITAGGTTGAWTVCATGLTARTIYLCLNDQVTPLTTTGTPGGTTVVTYGRLAVGVANAGRVVMRVTGSPVSFNPGIAAPFDASTSITKLSLLREGRDEGLWDQGKIFNPDYLSKLTAGGGAPGAIRALNNVNENYSLEVNWADRKPITYYSWTADMYGRQQSTFVGTTTSVLNDYSGSLGVSPADKTQVALAFDSTPVSVATSGLVTWTGHGLYLGQAFNFFIPGGTAPGGVTIFSSNVSVPYYAITTCGSCDADHIQFATSYANAVAGTNVTPSSTGSNVVAHSTTLPATVTVTNGNSTLTWTANNLTANEPVACVPGSGTAMGSPFNQWANYYVKSPTTNTISLTDTPGGATALTPSSGGTFTCVRSPTYNGIPIKDRGGWGVGLVKNTAPKPATFTSSQIVYGVMTYDKITNSWQKIGADDSQGNSYFTSGMPPEMFARLAYELGAHPWFPSPYLVLDGYTDPTTHLGGITDYMPSLASYMKSTYRDSGLATWMVPRYEIHNEQFNSLFPATQLGTAHAFQYSYTASPYYAGWVKGDLSNYVGKVGSVLGQAINAVYGGAVDSSKYEVMVGFQTFNFAFASGPTSGNNFDRFESSDYIGQSAMPQSGYALDPASDWLTNGTGAQYFGTGYDTNTPPQWKLVNDFAGGVITGSMAAGSNQLVVSATRAALYKGPFGIGSVVTQGPGVPGPMTVLSGGPSTWTMDTTVTNPVGSTNLNYYSGVSDPNAPKTYVDGTTYTAYFTGSISGTTLTVASVTSGQISVGGGSGSNFISGTGVPAYAQIKSQLTSTTTNANITASGSSSTLHVSAINSGAINPGDYLSNIGPGVYIREQLATQGADVATYQMNTGSTFASTTLNLMQSGKEGTYQLTGSLGTVPTFTDGKSYGVFSLTSENIIYTNFAAFVKSYTNKDSYQLKPNGYEGGWSNDYGSGGLSPSDQLTAQSKLTTSTPQYANGVYDPILLNAQNAAAQGIEFPSLFQYTGISPSNNVWSSLDDLYQPGPTPYFNAYKAYHYP